MEILGVGPLEVIAIFIIMLVVAGPKRMARWAYIAGQYVARFRAMFQETMAAIQKEFEESGMDVRKDIQEIKQTTSSLKNFDVVGEAAKVINQPVDSTSTEAKLQKPSETDTDTETPRYDSWLPG